MNILEQAVSIAASTWEQDKTYEQAMLEAFYDVRGQEMQEKKARESWTSKSCATGKNRWQSVRRWVARLIQTTIWMTK